MAPDLLSMLPGGSPRGSFSSSSFSASSFSSSLLRWLGVRLWARRRLLLVALLWFGSWLFLNGLVLVQRSILSDFCTEKHSRQILSRLCGEFRDGSVSGDMCSDLCEVGLLQFRRCLYYENGKKVMEAEWRGSTVILKSKMENFSSYEPLNILEYQVLKVTAVSQEEENTGKVSMEMQNKLLQCDSEIITFKVTEYFK